MDPGAAKSHRLFFLLSGPGNGNSAESLFRTSASECLSRAGVLRGKSYVTQDESRKLAIFDIASDFDAGIRQSPTTLSGHVAQSFTGANTHHRLYRVINERESLQGPGTVLLVVSMQPGPDLEEQEFHDWYEEEHTPLFSKIPGWRGTRRAELVETDEEAGKVPRFLALHEWESYASFDTDEYRHATTTDWQKSVVGRVIQWNRERILFDLDATLIPTAAKS